MQIFRMVRRSAGSQTIPSAGEFAQATSRRLFGAIRWPADRTKAIGQERGTGRCG